jgi:hypothetical protein
VGTTGAARDRRARGLPRFVGIGNLLEEQAFFVCFVFVVWPGGSANQINFWSDLLRSTA